MTQIIKTLRTSLALAAAAGALLAATATASANPLRLFSPVAPQAPQALSYAPVETEEAAPSRFKRQVVNYASHEAPGTIIIDTPNTYLYLVIGNGKAMRYGIGVGREGFTWAGTKTVEKKAEWPDWTPPAEMLQRQPYLPRFMAGGPGNPLGARAMYLSGSVYRIHGTNAPQTIGQRVSSGCIRLTNEDVADLYDRVKLNTKVIVLPMTERRMVSNPVRDSRSASRPDP